MDAGGGFHPGRSVWLVGSEEIFREDGWNGLPYVSGSRHPVRGGIQMADGRRGVILPLDIASENTVFGVWVVDGVGVAGSLPTDAAQEGNGRETSSGYHGPQRRATHL